MSERRSMTEITRWRYGVAALAGIAVFSGLKGLVNYGDLTTARLIADHVQAEGDDYFKGASQQTVDGLVNELEVSVGGAVTFSVMALGTYAIGGRKQKETEPGNP